MVLLCKFLHIILFDSKIFGFVFFILHKETKINNTSKQNSSVNLIREQAVKKVNMALEMGDPEQLVQALKVILMMLLLKFEPKLTKELELKNCKCSTPKLNYQDISTILIGVFA